MARRCAMCWTANRTQLEQRVIEGDSIQLIADEIGVNPSAVYRHLRLHVREQVRTELANRGAAVHVADLAERLVGLMDEAATVRNYARTVNDPRLLLQAAESERSTVMILVKQLGIDRTDLVTSVRDAQIILGLVGKVLRPHPEVMRELISELRRHSSQRNELSDLADVLECSLLAPSTGSAQLRSIQPKESHA